VGKYQALGVRLRCSSCTTRVCAEQILV
jgi:hypothetical protein